MSLFYSNACARRMVWGVNWINMDREKKQLIINATIEMLEEYGVSNYDDWYNQDEEESMELYENMKAGILEEFDIDDEDMDKILDEIFDEYLC